mgnify:CR=1 FL=1
MKSELAGPGPRYQALLNLLRTAESLCNVSREFFAQWDLSPSQFNVLNVLCDSPNGLTQIELSRQLIMHRSNVTGLVDRLEKRGLVRRQDIAGDRRANQVVLTAQGRRLLEKVLPEYYLAAEQIWGDFPISQTKSLVEGLEKLRKNADALNAEGH